MQHSSDDLGVLQKRIMVFLELHVFPNFRNVGSVWPAQQLIKLISPKCQEITKTKVMPAHALSSGFTAPFTFQFHPLVVSLLECSNVFSCGVFHVEYTPHRALKGLRVLNCFSLIYEHFSNYQRKRGTNYA